MFDLLNNVIRSRLLITDSTMFKTHFYLLIFLLLAFLGCNRQSSVSKVSSFKNDPKAGSVEMQALDPLRVILAEQPGKASIDLEILKLQEKIKKSGDPSPLLEKLGWLFVSKARTSFDPGYYKLAEQCALCLESKNPESLEALLLRGHVLHSLHRFKDAETIARKLVVKREFAFDYGLLGDVLMDKGVLSKQPKPVRLPFLSSGIIHQHSLLKDEFWRLKEKSSKLFKFLNVQQH